MATDMEITMDTKIQKNKIYSDLHCHVLPNIDDGASDVQVSIKIIDLMENEGIQNIVATPHFYLNKTNVKKFIKKRNRSYQELIENYNGSLCKNICLGAEVYYCNGIYRIENFEKLAMGKSNYILLELPYLPKIDIDIINDIEQLMQKSGFTVILAHIERFLKKMTWRASRKLFSLNIIYQINLSSLLEPKLRSTTLKFVKKGAFVVLGSDSHDIFGRSPTCYSQGIEIIYSHLGIETTERLIKNTNCIFYDTYNDT